MLIQHIVLFLHPIFNCVEGAFESSWSKYSIAIIAYANASRTKSKGLKHVLREEGTKSHVYRCGVIN